METHLPKKRLIIVAQQQFGYQSDTYYYCKYLKDQFNVTYISWDWNEPPILMRNVRVVQIPRDRSLMMRGIRLTQAVKKEIGYGDAIVFIKYIKFMSILIKLLNPNNIFVFDVRTGSIDKNSVKRSIYDWTMRLEAICFKNKSVISRSLARKLRFKGNAYILSVGSDIFSYKDKAFNELNFLYVGTLYNRNIDQTIEGFYLFYKSFKDKIQLKYTIIGSGTSDEIKNIKKLIEKYSLTETVFMVGQKQHHELKEYFDSHNIGISYVPKTSYYDVQPPTKTFEYLLSGMPVVATSTSENMNVIHEDNGVLVGDTPAEFCRGLTVLYDARNKYDSKNIRDSMLDYTWENIAKGFSGYLFSLTQAGQD